MPLNIAPNISDPDGFYEELINSQREMTDAEAQAMNARLVLLLANHIGDRATLTEAMRSACIASGGSRCSGARPGGAIVRPCSMSRPSRGRPCAHRLVALTAQTARMTAQRAIRSSEIGIIVENPTLLRRIAGPGRERNAAAPPAAP